MTRRPWVFWLGGMILLWFAFFYALLGDWYAFTLVCAVPVLALVMTAIGLVVGLRIRRKLVVQPGQAEAVAIVWRDTFGRLDKAPTVAWVLGRRKFWAFITPSAKHPTGIAEVGGVTYSSTLVSCAWWQGARFSETTLCHELNHAALAREGVFDPHHRGPSWQPGGRVERAEMALAKAGL